MTYRNMKHCTEALLNILKLKSRIIKIKYEDHKFLEQILERPCTTTCYSDMNYSRSKKSHSKH